MNDDFEIKIVFASDTLSRKFQNSIQEFLINLLKDEPKSRFHFDTLPQNKENTMDGPLDFIVVKEPIQNGYVVPTADSSSRNETMLKVEEPPKQESENFLNSNPSSITCFNCLGNHHLKACPDPHDSSRISENRKDIMEANSNSSRYFNDSEIKMNSFKPGIMSDALYKALGLQKSQLAIHIYNMRILGYPPGWLKEAEIRDTTLKICDSNESINKDKTPEISTVQYDYEKFAEYSGFNCAVPEGIKDEWEKLQMLPLQKHQQLSEVKNHNGVHLTSNKRKSNVSSASSASKKHKQNGDSKQEDTKNEATALLINPMFSNGSPVFRSDKCLPNNDSFSSGMSEFLPEILIDQATGCLAKFKEVFQSIQETIEAV